MKNFFAHFARKLLTGGGRTHGDFAMKMEFSRAVCGAGNPESAFF